MVLEGKLVGRDLVQCMVVELELLSSIVLLWLNLWDRRICAVLSFFLSFCDVSLLLCVTGFGMWRIVY